MIMNHKAVRVSIYDLKKITRLFIKHFAVGDKLWLFGSRTDLVKKGGDLDLYIETNLQDPAEITNAKLNFLVDLDINLGEQKVDIVINDNKLKLPIYKIAKAEGVRLV